MTDMLKITQFDIFHYQLPLAIPLTLKKQSCMHRCGMIIAIGDSQHCGYGEISPLPGFHEETLLSAHLQVQQLKCCLSDKKLPTHFTELTRYSAELATRLSLYPTVCYGLEMALYNLLANRQAQTLAQLLNPHCHVLLPINGLLTADCNILTAQVQQFVQQGYAALKMKVGHLALHDDIQRVRQVRDVLNRCNSAVQLRLDANRQWDLITAVQFGQAIADCSIEYIEEPTRHWSHHAVFYQQTGLAFALDESLSQFNADDLESLGMGLKALVLKPALLGGFHKIGEWIKIAYDHDMQIILSSMFESGVGIAALANCAAAWIKNPLPMGFDTYRWLANDVLVKPLSMPHGLMDVIQAHHQAQQLAIPPYTPYEIDSLDTCG